MIATAGLALLTDTPRLYAITDIIHRQTIWTNVMELNSYSPVLYRGVTKYEAVLTLRTTLITPLLRLLCWFVTTDVL